MTAWDSHKTNGKHKSQADPYASPRRTRWDDCLPLPPLSPLLARSLIFILSLVCFAVSYDGEFVFDDSEAIVGNKDLLPETPISDLLYHDFWGNKLTNKSHKSYRPLTVITYRWNQQVAGGLHPVGFHVVNIVLHALVSVLFLSVFSRLLNAPGLSAATRGAADQGSGRVSKAAFLCSLLFAVHPVHTESVAAVVGRADLLCAVFFLLSFLAYTRACSDEDQGSIYRPESVNWSWLLLSALSCFLATFSKEQGITVVGICCAYDIILVSRLDPLKLIGFKSASPKAALHQNGHSRTHELAPWVRCLLHRQLVLVTSAVLVLLVRLKVMGLSPPTFQIPDNPHSFVNGSIYRGLNYNYLYSINAWLLLNPWWLCFDWSMGCVPTITSLADPRIIFVALFWAVLGALLWHTLSGDLAHEKRCALIGLAFLVVPFLPASNLLFRVGFVIAERNLYLPSAGFCILVTMGMVRLSSYQRLRQMVGLAVSVLCVCFVARSIHRSRHWQRELTLYSTGEQVCPLNGKVHYNIAKLQADRGEVDYAISKYRLAIQLNPQYDQAMNNLANILKDRGDNQEARALLTQAVTINPEFAAAWMNLGIVQAQLQLYQAAEQSYRTAILHRRNYPDCYYNLGNLYLDQKRHQEALEAWHNATRLKPQHVNSWSNAIILLDSIGRLEQAVKMGEVALGYLPSAPMLWFNVANVRGKLEQWSQSQAGFLSAIRLDPTQARFHLNLGVLYHRWGKFDEAEKAYRVALELDPSNPSTQENINMLQKRRETVN